MPDDLHDLQRDIFILRRDLDRTRSEVDDLRAELRWLHTATGLYLAALAGCLAALDVIVRLGAS